MSTVKVGSNEFICPGTVKPLCSNAVKTLEPRFEKALAVSAKRSENFVTELDEQSAALEKMAASFNAKPAAWRTQKSYDSLIAFAKRENDEIATLFETLVREPGPDDRERRPGGLCEGGHRQG